MRARERRLRVLRHAHEHGHFGREVGAVETVESELIGLVISWRDSGVHAVHIVGVAGSSREEPART